MSVGLIIVLMGVMLSGCSSNEDSSNETSNTTVESNTDSTEETSQDEKSIELRFSWWGGDERHEGTLAFVDAYANNNSSVSIKPEYGGWDGYYQKLTTQLAGGTAPDIIQIDQPWIYELSQNQEMFLDLNTVSEYIDFTSFDENFLESYCTIDGKLLGLPTGVNGVVALENVEKLKEADIDENIVWDWDKLLEEGIKYRNYYGDENYLLINSIEELNRYVFQYYIMQSTGNELIDDAGELGFDAADAEKAYAYIIQLIDNNVVVPPEEMTAYDGKVNEHPKWINDQVGMTINYASTFPVYVGDEGDKYQSKRIPIIEGTENTGVVVRPSQLIAINNNSDHKEAVAKVLNDFMNEEESVKLLATVRGIPASNKAVGILTAENAISELEAEAIEIALDSAGIKQSIYVNDQEITQLFVDITQQVMFKNIDPSEAGDILVTDLVKLIDSKK